MSGGAQAARCAGQWAPLTKISGPAPRAHKTEEEASHHMDGIVGGKHATDLGATAFWQCVYTQAGADRALLADVVSERRVGLTDRE